MADGRHSAATPRSRWRPAIFGRGGADSNPLGSRYGERAAGESCDRASCIFVVEWSATSLSGRDTSGRVSAMHHRTLVRPMVVGRFSGTPIPLDAAVERVVGQRIPGAILIAGG